MSSRCCDCFFCHWECSALASVTSTYAVLVSSIVTTGFKELWFRVKFVNACDSTLSKPTEINDRITGKIFYKPMWQQFVYNHLATRAKVLYFSLQLWKSTKHKCHLFCALSFLKYFLKKPVFPWDIGLFHRTVLSFTVTCLVHIHQGLMIDCGAWVALLSSTASLCSL